jgi:iron complex transport system substrate-binding protein
MIDRRLCLTWLGALPWASAGAVGLAREPRVVSLSWEATEHLLQVDVTPMAVADAADYRTWYVQPALPSDVPGVGSRTEPNLELLARWRPDLIVMSPMLEDMRSRLAGIAPLMPHPGFSQAHDNFAAQRRGYLDIAARLGRETLARERLATMDHRLAGWRDQLRRRFGTALPSVAVVRFSSPTVVFFNGPNSMPQHALDALGLRSAHPVPAADWGITQAPVVSLGQVREGVVLHIEPFAQQSLLFRTALWRSMPFVRARRFASLPPIWTYGGVFSVERLAGAITEALLSLDVR